MHNNGTAGDVFYNMSPDDLNPEWWSAFIKQQCQLFAILEFKIKDPKEEPGTLGIVGMCWLNNVVGRRADIHYCMFKPAWGRSAEICAEAMEVLFKQTNIDCFIALVPSTNKQALDKALEYGFKSSAIIPKACYIAALGKSVNGHQYHMTRKRSK